MKIRCMLVVSVVAALAASGVVFAGLQVKRDKENVVASRLEGKWAVHPELNLRLTGRPVARGESVANRAEFAVDDAVAARIPERYDRFFTDKAVYLAGTMTLLGKKYPFVVISHRGNPHVVYFRERGGDPMGDTESFNVMLAVAKNRRNDLLFIGGDFNNQPFAAFQRTGAD